MAKAREAFIEQKAKFKAGQFSTSLVYEEAFDKGAFKTPDEIPQDFFERFAKAQDMELKRFFNFIGIPIEGDTTTEEVKGRLKLAGIIMQKIVTVQPRVNGFYIFEREALRNEYALLCVISDPFYEDGKVKIVRRVPE